MRAFSESDTVVRSVVAGLLLAAAGGAFAWWRSYTQDREARRGALPGCVARLGSEATCAARFDEHHRQCFNSTNKPAGKYSPRQFDAGAYLDCIVLGPEDWGARRRDAKAAQQRQDRLDGVPAR